MNYYAKLKRGLKRHISGITFEINQVVKVDSSLFDFLNSQKSDFDLYMTKEELDLDKINLVKYMRRVKKKKESTVESEIKNKKEDKEEKEKDKKAKKEVIEDKEREEDKKAKKEDIEDKEKEEIEPPKIKTIE